jgi:chromate reductase, NAD(P)H dehydrogenase (quinone)
VTKLIGISGSLRQGSYNAALLRAAAKLMPEGAELTVGTIKGIPLYDADQESAEGIPAPVAALKDALAAADGLLLVTPEYNNSIPGVLKNAIDWLSRTKPQPFKDKPVALVSASAGPVGGARHQYELRKVLGCLEAHVLTRPEIFIGSCQEKFDLQGHLIDPKALSLMSEQMRAFEQWIQRLRPSGLNSASAPAPLLETNT